MEAVSLREVEASAKDEVAPVNVETDAISGAVTSVKDDAAYVNEIPPTVYVPVLDPSEESLARRKDMLPPVLFVPEMYIFPRLSTAIP